MKISSTTSVSHGSPEIMTPSVHARPSLPQGTHVRSTVAVRQWKNDKTHHERTDQGNQWITRPCLASKISDESPSQRVSGYLKSKHDDHGRAHVFRGCKAAFIPCALCYFVILPRDHMSRVSVSSRKPSEYCLCPETT